jgi:hypothetical protein
MVLLIQNQYFFLAESTWGVVYFDPRTERASTDMKRKSWMKPPNIECSNTNNVEQEQSWEKGTTSSKQRIKSS